MQNDNNEVKPGLFKRAGASIKNTADTLKQRTESAIALANGDMQSGLLAMIMPHVKKMIPKMERNLKNYLSGNTTEYGGGDGVHKAILMKLRDDGTVGIMIFNSEAIEINVSEGFVNNPQDALLQQLKLDEYVLKFMQGNFDVTPSDSEQL